LNSESAVKAPRSTSQSESVCTESN